MTFPYPESPEEWQNAYTRDQAHGESGKYSARSNMFFLAGVFIVSIYLSVLALPHVDLASMDPRLAVALAMGLMGLVSIMFMVIYSRALRFAIMFVFEFYRAPDEINISKMIQYRLNGMPKLPPPLNLFFKFEYILAKEGEFVKSSEWPVWISSRLGGPLLLIVFDGCALYLERGNRFSRVVGPGSKAPFLEWYETVKYVVDLRPKVKDGSVDAWTKDGIKVSFDAQIECRIGDPQNRDSASNLVYPYDPVAVKKAIERHALRWLPDRATGEPVEFTWVDAVWGQVTGILPDYIGSRMLDDLFIADRQRGQILSPEAVKEIFKRINERTQTFGVYVTNFQVLKVTLPVEVESALKELWKAEKQSHVTVRDGALKAQQIRTQEQARARAQHDLVMNIADGLMKNKGTNYAEPLLLSFSRILDESLDDPLMRAYLANETLETLSKIKDMLK